MASSKSVVIAALIANGAIAVLKFLGFLLTGSPAMLSETYHSISDTGNQVFLLIGIRYSGREASKRHPFGYGKAQFFYSFLVSVLLFGIAGWESAKHGYDAIMHPGHGGGHPVDLLGYVFPPVYVNYAVLIGAFIFESWALYKANKAIKKQMAERGWDSYREAFQKTSDITTLTALTEDTIALVGVTLAFFGIVLTQLTGNPVYDAVSALLIGILLMGFALALAWENKRLLIGESLPESRVEDLRRVVREHDGVADLVDFQTVYFGPEELLVTADVNFEDGLETGDIEALIDRIETALIETDDHITRVFVEPEA